MRVCLAQLGFVCLSGILMLRGDGRIGAVFAQAQDEPRAADHWAAYTRAGKDLRARGFYREAERPFMSALEEAEKGSPSDPRLPASLDNLALLYFRQGEWPLGARDPVPRLMARRVGRANAIAYVVDCGES
jgi:hypothetical protein